VLATNMGEGKMHCLGLAAFPLQMIDLLPHEAALFHFLVEHCVDVLLLATGEQK